MKNVQKLITEKRIWIVMVIILLASLLPIVQLAFYNYPCADDFSASDSVRLAWLNTGSFIAVIKAAWENVIYNYLEWSGVFMSVFWTSLQFGIFGERFYGITTLIAVVLLVGGGFYLARVILTGYLKADKYVAGIIAVLYLFSTIQCMPDGNEGLYWHAGVVNYTWAFAFLLLLLAVVLSGYKEKKQSKKILKIVCGCILAVFVGGGNYLTALQGSMWMILVSVAAWGMTGSRNKKEFSKKLITNLGIFLPAICLVLSFVLSVTAPGNEVRMSGAQGFGALKAVLVSFYYCLTVPLQEWTTWPVVILLAMAIPFMWKTARRSGFLFPCPFLAVFLGFGMVSAGFTPNLYAQGQVGGGRLADTIFFLWIFWLYVVTFYVVGWFSRFMERREKGEFGRITIAQLYVCLIGCFWLGCSCLHFMIDEDVYVGTQAFYSIRTGQAENYRKDNENRLALLYNEDVKNVVFSGFSDPPDLLLFQDITYDANDWLNQVMAEYYGKESVKCE